MLFGKYLTVAVVFVFLFSLPVFSKNIAVMPFNNTSNNKEDNWIGAGFAETLAVKLAKVKELNLLDREQLLKMLDETKYHLSGVVEEKTAVKTARIYGVNVIVLGSYQAMENTLQTNAMFIDVETRKVIETAEATGNISDVFQLQDKIAFGLIDTLKIVPAEDERQEIKVNPTENLTAYQWSCKGNDASNLKLYDKAIEYYEASTGFDPGYEAAYLGMSSVYGKKENYDKAIELCKKALGINPNSAKAYNYMGSFYSRKGNYDKAIELYKRASRINPNSAEVYFNMGAAYGQKRSYSTAIELYKKAVNINPDYAQAYFNMGVMYAQKRNFDKAIDMYEQVTAIEPQYAQAYSNMGMAYDNKGNFDKAIEMCKKAVNIDPEDAQAYNNLGIAYSDKGDYDNAIKMFEKAVSIDAELAQAYYGMGMAYNETGNYEMSVTCLKKAARLGFAQARQILNKGAIEW